MRNERSYVPNFLKNPVHGHVATSKPDIRLEFRLKAAEFYELRGGESLDIS